MARRGGRTQQIKREIEGEREGEGGRERERKGGREGERGRGREG